MHCITLPCMDAQLTVRIPTHLRDALDRASRNSGLKQSEIVRRALQQHLSVPHEKNKRPADRVRNLLGSLDSGIPDLSEEQRKYVIGSLTGGK